ncbi:Zn(II)2Cys6 transcription factor domain-containing protein, partial [Aspergillus ibericus CBS 121593]
TMTARQSSPTSDHSHSDGNVRKRVCKACDRCRLKKSKCDGANPCGRCRTDNAICVFGERKKAHDKVYPKGYVEMLEQQQTWLVNGLQELYRRAMEGESWPGEPLRCEANGHPLTHDLLTRLGALDQSKGERFEENTEAMQQDLWRHNAGHMQRQESSDGSSESAQSPILPSRFSDSTPSQAQGPTIKSEPHMAPTNPAFVAPMTLQGVVNPLALQTPQQWPANNFGTFEDMDLIGASDYTNLSFEDQVPPSMFNRHHPMSCMLSSSYMDTKGDYEDINQFLNANAPEIAST